MISITGPTNQLTIDEKTVRPFQGVTVTNPSGYDTIFIHTYGNAGVSQFPPDSKIFEGPIGGELELSGPTADLTYVLDNFAFTPYEQGVTTFSLTDATDSSGGTFNVTDFGPPPTVHPNDLALSGDVTGPHDFIDMPNFVASYGDLINAFGTNQQAAQNWYNTREPIEQRAETFDGLDYVASYPDLISAFKSAGSEHATLDAGATHFIDYGHNEGRTTTFNGLDYIASYGDLIKALGANGDAGAYHYIDYGHNEGRTVSFDGLDYIASYPDLIAAFGANEQAGAEHFIQDGYSEGRTTTFNGLDYIASYGDLIQLLGANDDAGATHYIEYGHSEGRTTTFDGLDYIATYGDLIQLLGANEQAGATHFIDLGYKQNRTTTFDGLSYIANYTDLMNAFGADNDAGATHYITHGFNEHRSAEFIFHDASGTFAAADAVTEYEKDFPTTSGFGNNDDAFFTAYIDTYKSTGKFLGQG
jgi:hypothetical protein